MRCNAEESADIVTSSLPGDTLMVNLLQLMTTEKGPSESFEKKTKKRRFTNLFEPGTLHMRFQRFSTELDPQLLTDWTIQLLAFAAAFLMRLSDYHMACQLHNACRFSELCDVMHRRGQ